MLFPCHQPGVYRQIMDDVVNGVRPDFDEMGIDERVLDALQKVRFVCSARSCSSG